MAGPPPLHGALVEIDGVGEAVEARDRHLGLLGATVSADGRRGWALWNAERDGYVVQTLDGLLLEVPEESLHVSRKLEPEDGGYDLEWPALPASSRLFASMACEMLQAKGFCLVQMFESDLMRRSVMQAARQRDDFTLPAFEFEEAYLGRNHSSKVAWLGGPALNNPRQDTLLRYNDYLVALAHVLLPISQSHLGFKPHEFLSGTMLRMPLERADERQELSPGCVASEAIQAGVVEEHLDFLQRRRLCIMYMVDNDGGTLELFLREDLGERVVRLPITKDRLLVFRCDLMGYSYQPRSGRDVVLQTWFMEEPPQLKIDSFEGEQRGIEAIIGGPNIPLDMQVHVMAAFTRFPGNGYQVDRSHLVWTMQVDSFVEIPLGRFDMSAYYAPESDQFNSGGRSVTKHCGALADVEWTDFDNQFFGMEAELAAMIPPIQRCCLESSVEILTSVGYTTRQSMEGNRHMMIVIGDIGTDWDGWFGLNHGTVVNPDIWLKAGVLANSITSANRLHYLLGLEGPSVQVDTACSASMVACGMCHAQLRKSEKGTTEALLEGFQNILTPWTFIGLSGAGMVGRTGRCLFFDQSGNGFARGEGLGGLFMSTGASVEKALGRLCSCASTFVNQDGRSASLTAPNGPSQQAVIRSSLANIKLHADEVVCTENHGTGTALGDPIEAGTVRSVFGRKRQSGPIPVTSGKSHMGHLEPGAGAVGIIKTITALVHAAVPANVHLRHLNAHIEYEGFPGLFPTERTDLESEYHYGGANGFGFGGTNARADFWARRLHRVRDAAPSRELIGAPLLHKQVLPQLLPRRMEKLDCVTLACARCRGPMCWLCGAVPVPGAGRHRCSAVREEFASYDYCANCYEGGYHLGSAEEPREEAGVQPVSMPGSQDFFLTGTWSAWSTFDEMFPAVGTADADVYECEITLGETRMECFQVAMQRSGAQSFFLPVHGGAGQGARIVGPEPEADPSKFWRIDGRRDGVPVGTVYQVRFAWGDSQKWIMWQPTEKRRLLQEIWQNDYSHTYSICCAASDWRPLDMRQNADLLDLWEVASRIPRVGEAEFVVQRDHDPAQTLYPLHTQPKDSSVPVVGPDDGASDKRWLIWGKPGEVVIFRLCIKEDGDFTLQVIGDTMGELTWQSPIGCAGVVYGLVGSFNDWSFSKDSEMEPDASSPDLRRCRLKIGRRCREEFQILVNQNWDRRMYPEVAKDPPGVGCVCGPDDKADGRNWEVVGYPGQVVEVVLNLGAEDQRSMVTCWALEDGGRWDGKAVSDKREWTDAEWEAWEAECANGAWDGSSWNDGSGWEDDWQDTSWPSEYPWPGADKQAVTYTLSPLIRKDPLADGLNPWTEERIEE